MHIGKAPAKLKNKVINKLKMYQSNVKSINKDEGTAKKSLPRKQNNLTKNHNDGVVLPSPSYLRKEKE